MKYATTIALSGALALTLSACAGGQRPGPPPQVIDRALKTAPGAAQPSTVVATEIAFARVAKEKGQWTAFREFAAPGAMLHGRNGAFTAEAFLAQQSDPEKAVQWAPRTIVMSCDGALAVSLGRYQDPEGLVGNFVTVWERQSDNAYKWVYDVGGPDTPQPPPRKEIEDGDIVVTAIDAVQGLVATCPRAGEAIPPPPADSSVGVRAQDAKTSRDGTLRWRFEHRGEGEKFIAAEYFYNGQWVTAIEESLASSPEG
ncbi:hypothetical protein [Erythrobacter sp. THAF29]|uniref:hypothetical protein n=1 Tax=Erythrobacter sp. THAF29 TaxID=2587851 RepID=UPI001268F1C5|nr:hypothetical protein [Erythrobacter sp. THAF29]QFT76658.1 hypothetical protein FIU90_03775 [Erythrobacter sp. THAF29]